MNIIDKLLPYLIGLMVTVIVGMLLYGLYLMIDECWLPITVQPVIVTSKYFVPAHSRDEYNVALKMYTTQDYPDSWDIEVVRDNQTDTMSLRHSVWDRVVVGGGYQADVSYGRFSGRFFIRAIYL